MRTKAITLYKFNELPTERVKEKARDWLRNIILEDCVSLAEHATDEFKEALYALGFDVSMSRGTRSQPAIYWDTNPIGAAFVAQWSAHWFMNRANIRDKLLKDRPASFVDKNGVTQPCKGNAELHRIAEGLLKLVLQFPDASGDCGSGRHGCNQQASFDCGDESQDESFTEFEETFKTLVSDLAHGFATNVNEEIEYQTSDEAVDEAMEANEYEFTEDGSIA